MSKEQKRTHSERSCGLLSTKQEIQLMMKDVRCACLWFCVRAQTDQSLLTTGQLIKIKLRKLKCLSRCYAQNLNWPLWVIRWHFFSIAQMDSQLILNAAFNMIKIKHLREYNQLSTFFFPVSFIRCRMKSFYAKMQSDGIRPWNLTISIESHGISNTMILKYSLCSHKTKTSEIQH